MALARQSGSWWVAGPLLAAAVSLGLIGLGFLCLGPRVLLKRPAGDLHPVSYLLHWPYHALNALALLLARRSSRAADEITPGVFLGRRLTAFDRSLVKQLGFVGVLDLTCEFSEYPALRALPHYRCIPLLDTTAPTDEELREGVEFIRKARREGPVLVHCALGHGRSAAFVVAYLLAEGVAADLPHALDLIRQPRPGIALSGAQAAALEEWTKRSWID